MQQSEYGPGLSPAGESRQAVETVPDQGASGPLGPIREGERLIVLDVLRGIAMLGILFVNMLFFSLPMSSIFSDPGLLEGPRTDLLAWGIVQVFFTYKFISLFSLLFGVGLVVQMTRAEARGRAFVPVYLRRLGLLAVIGLCHGLLLWHGDILFVYSVVGVALLLMRRLPGSALVWVSGALICVSLMLALGFGSLQVLSMAFQSERHDQPVTAMDEGVPPDAVPAATAPMGPEQPEMEGQAGSPWDEPEMEGMIEESPAAAETEPQEPPRGWRAIVAAQGQPMHPVWKEAETHAYKYGPFKDAFAFRAASYGYALIGAICAYGWRVLGMFALGAAMMKLGFFLPESRRWQKLLFFAGFLVGLPLEIFAALVMANNGFAMDWINLFGSTLHDLASFLLCLGYVGGICLLVHAGLLKGICRAFATVGRMALSAYLSETIICTALMYWWGLGWFGDVPRSWQLLLAPAVYAVVMIGCNLWMRFFTIGPFEWLWRTLTYWRLQPVLRKHDG